MTSDSSHRISRAHLEVMSLEDLRIHLQTLTRMLERYTLQDQEVVRKYEDDVGLVRYLISVKEADDDE